MKTWILIIVAVLVIVAMIALWLIGCWVLFEETDLYKDVVGPRLKQRFSPPEQRR